LAVVEIQVALLLAQLLVVGRVAQASVPESARWQPFAGGYIAPVLRIAVLYTGVTRAGRYEGYRGKNEDDSKKHHHSNAPESAHMTSFYLTEKKELKAAARVGGS
jgi:hypothetical protein